MRRGVASGAFPDHAPPRREGPTPGPTAPVSGSPHDGQSSVVLRAAAVAMRRPQARQRTHGMMSSWCRAGRPRARGIPRREPRIRGSTTLRRLAGGRQTLRRTSDIAAGAYTAAGLRLVALLSSRTTVEAAQPGSHVVVYQRTPGPSVKAKRCARAPATRRPNEGVRKSAGAPSTHRRRCLPRSAPPLPSPSMRHPGDGSCRRSALGAPIGTPDWYPETKKPLRSRASCSARYWGRTHWAACAQSIFGSTGSVWCSEVF
jgi:hypothetical protein